MSQTLKKPDADLGLNTIVRPDFHPEPGARLHQYELIRLIGRGSRGAVYLARDTRLGRRVAIKFLPAQSAELTRRFVLETRTTAACSHENIVALYEVDAWQGTPFMVFEHLVGQTLTKLMPEERALPAPRVVDLLAPVVRALAYAHSQGVVHRDLKPDNVFICDTGVTKVLDFGVAKALQPDERAGEALTEQSTRLYLAPEQWGIGVPIDHRADLWPVGIMLFTMLSGKHPLEPLRGQQLMVTGILDSPMPLLTGKTSDAPRELATIVDRCLMKRKEQRWPDAVTLLRALEPFQPGRFVRELKLDESPYVGLAAFQEGDAARYFGRGQELAATVNRVRECPLVAIVGPSGIGKSSFVRAGLVPALKRCGEPWEAFVLRPGRRPLSALAALITPMVRSSVISDVAEQQQLAQRVSAEPGFVGTVLRAHAVLEHRNLLVFVDQFEELYTLVHDPSERRAFTAALAAAADDATSPIRLVLSIRSDFLDRISEDLHLMGDLSRGLVFLAAPGKDALREAITAPAQLAGFTFDSLDIVDDVVTHLQATRCALPLLQFAATRLWETRDPARKVLTREAYEAMGGVGGALASHADQVVGKLNLIASQLVRAVFVRLVTPERTRAIVSMDELRELHPSAEQLLVVVDELVQARLLTVHTGVGGATVELIHDSLVHRWPTLKRWLDESGEDAAFVEELRNGARAWHGKNRPDDLLWRGELAEEAERFSRRYRGPLSDLQRAFLTATVALKNRGARRRVRAMTTAVVASALVATGTAVAMLSVRQVRDDAQDQAIAAREAENSARQKQEEAEAREAARTKAAAEAEARRTEADRAREELRKALAESEEARKRALEAERSAGQNANAALEARAASESARLRSERLARQVQENLEKERARVKRLEEQSASDAIDTLK